MVAFFLERMIKDRLRPARGGVKTFWWRKAGLLRDRPNFGDELTPDMLDRHFGIECTWSHPKRCELIGAGSILEMALMLGGTGIKVWGSGYMKEDHQFDHPDLDFYAVRGKLTLSRISTDRSVALGDPGLLASLVYPRTEMKSDQIGFVYHYTHRDEPFLRKLAKSEGYKIINPLRNPEEVVADITGCRFVFSTSLHGLIISDSFGIPNAWVSLKDSIGGGRYKYEDYYSAFDGSAVQYSPEVVLDRDSISHLEREYTGIPNLTELQQGLIDSFPKLRNYAQLGT